MKCPKCGGEIPFYDLRPNCKHCGVNIFYYSQDDLLARDAKRTELEAASARMLIARIKASFVGGSAQIVRLVFVLLSAASLMVPLGSIKFTVPFFAGGLSAGLIGVFQELNGLLPKLPQLLSGAMTAPQAKAQAVCLGFLLAMVILALAVLVIYILSFTDPNKRTKTLRGLSLTAVIVAVLGQAAALVLNAVIPDAAHATFTPGFGGAVTAASFLVLFLLNAHLVKKGITPVYREYDPKRKELLTKVRAGEVDLDSLPLPIFESEEEHEARMQALHASQEEEAKDLAEESASKEVAQ